MLAAASSWSIGMPPRRCLPLELIRSRWLRLGALGGLLNTATPARHHAVTLYLQDSHGAELPAGGGQACLPFSRQ